MDFDPVMASFRWLVKQSNSYMYAPTKLGAELPGPSTAENVLVHIAVSV
jgi:hypothetical protein